MGKIIFENKNGYIQVRELNEGISLAGIGKGVALAGAVGLHLLATAAEKIAPNARQGAFTGKTSSLFGTVVNAISEMDRKKNNEVVKSLISRMNQLKEVQTGNITAKTIVDVMKPTGELSEAEENYLIPSESYSRLLAKYKKELASADTKKNAEQIHRAYNASTGNEDDGSVRESLRLYHMFRLDEKSGKREYKKEIKQLKNKVSGLEREREELEKQKKELENQKKEFERRTTKKESGNKTQKTGGIEKELDELMGEETPSVDTLVAWFGKDKISRETLETLGVGTEDEFDPANRIPDQRISELASQVKESLTKQRANLEKQFNNMFTDAILKDPEKALKQFPRQLTDMILTDENKKALSKTKERRGDDEDLDEDELLLILCRALYVILGDDRSENGKYLTPGMFRAGEFRSSNMGSVIDKKESKQYGSLFDTAEEVAKEIESGIQTGKLDLETLELCAKTLLKSINVSGMDSKAAIILKELKNNFFKLSDDYEFKNILSKKKKLFNKPTGDE